MQITISRGSGISGPGLGTLTACMAPLVNASGKAVEKFAQILSNFLERAPTDRWAAASPSRGCPGVMIFCCCADSSRIVLRISAFHKLLNRCGRWSSHPALDPAIYREATLRLDRHFTISIVDCGSSMDAPVTQEALRNLDALIMVSSLWADGALGRRPNHGTARRAR